MIPVLPAVVAPSGAGNTLLVVLLTLLLGSGGAAGAYAVFRKVRPETTGLLIDATQGAVIIQKEVLADSRREVREVKAALADERRERAMLETKVRELSGRIDGAEHSQARITQLQRELSVVLAEREALLEERLRLRNQIAALQERVARLEAGLNGPAKGGT